MKQSAMAATRRVSGDQTPPGPSNSGGGAVLSAGASPELMATNPVASDVALAR